MDKYYKRTLSEFSPSIVEGERSKKSRGEFNLSDLPHEPELRKNIGDYHFDLKDHVRREYLQRGPCQPKEHVFPKTQMGKISRRFVATWFVDFPLWLECSVFKDAAFCLYCYLLNQIVVQKEEQIVPVMLVSKISKKKKDILQGHEGKHNNFHNQAREKCDILMNENQHLCNIVKPFVEHSRVDYWVRLGASVDCIQFILRQGLAFCGHDESENSSNKDNFPELLQFLADHNDEVKDVALKLAPENHKLTSPDIQKEIVNDIAIETTNVVLQNMGDAFFSILVDESRDVSVKEQMAVIFRYVDKNGCVIEFSIGIEHVLSTTAMSLKKTIVALLLKHGLSISRLRGQGYDGAKYMSGEFNGLKTFILRENPSAFYVHCFSHQLQLALVGVSKKHQVIGAFFTSVASVVSIVGASSKRRDIF